MALESKNRQWYKTCYSTHHNFVALEPVDGLLSVVMEACDFASTSCQETGVWGLHRVSQSALHWLFEYLCALSFW